MMIRILGPVDLLTDDGVVVPKGRIGRKLLGALALSVNHAVTADRLAEIIWHESPPRSLANTLQTYIYRLREDVGHERIVGADHSYALAVAPEQLDALEFEQLVSLAAETRDNPAECIALCKNALSLWRGVPFGEFVDQDPFRLEAIRLDELRLYAMELKLAAELETGHEELVVGTLETLVEDYPYRERFWYLLIEAFALSGRRVDAVRAVGKLREILGEIGLEPSEEIRSLEDAVLSEGPHLHVRRPNATANHD